MMTSILSLYLPGIDKGDDSSVQAGWKDIEEMRIYNAHVDMGADEAPHYRCRW